MVYKHLFFIIVLFCTKTILAQSISENIAKAKKEFNKDRQLENAISSLYIVNADTKEVVFAENENVGLATASCLKLITSATAYELLGKDYAFTTKIMYSGVVANGVLEGDLIIQGSGDPSLGSPRWDTTKTGIVLAKIAKLVQTQGIKKINGNIIINDGSTINVTPSNWIWEDLGNYYGAPARLLNWRENQYDLHFATGKKIGDSATILTIDPEQPDVSLLNDVSTGEAGSGDNSVIYLPPYANYGVIKGKLPANETDFVVSGAMPNPTSVFGNSLKSMLQNNGVECSNVHIKSTATNGNKWVKVSIQNIGIITSPSLDKLNFWFMRRSINLFGEAFLNKMGEKETGDFNTNKGVNTIKNFWKINGIKSSALNIYDGSGLSPANRVTTKALVTVLMYAYKQPWFSGYLDAFPNYNNMKLKSGTIGDVKGFSGYHTAKNGTKYLISFLVNNYNGSSSALVGKMFKVLDVLK